MEMNIETENRERLIRYCNEIGKQLNTNIEAYAENNKGGRLAKHAIEIVVPLAPIIAGLYQTFEQEDFGTWMNQTLKGAHFHALACEAGQEFMPCDDYQPKLVKEYTKLVLPQVNYSEILEMKSTKEVNRYKKTVEEKVRDFFSKNFATFYNIKKTVDQYEAGNDWIFVSAIGVYIYFALSVSEEFEYEVTIPVELIDQLRRVYEQN